MQRGPWIVAMLAVAASARAETIRDSHAQFSIDIDAADMCVLVPRDRERAPACEAYSAFHLPEKLGPDAALDFFAVKRGAARSSFESIGVMRVDGDTAEVKPEEIAQAAQVAFDGMRDAGPFRNTSAVASSQFRVNGARVVTYSQDVDLVGPTRVVSTRQDTYVLMGKGAAYVIFTTSDQSRVTDVRDRIHRALATAKLDVAPPAPPPVGRLTAVFQRAVLLVGVVIVLGWWFFRQKKGRRKRKRSS